MISMKLEKSGGKKLREKNIINSGIAWKNSTIDISRYTILTTPTGLIDLIYHLRHFSRHVTVRLSYMIEKSSQF